MFHRFCWLVACSSSRILSATDHGANTFQNTHCRGGVRVAIATKRPKKVYQNAQSKMAFPQQTIWRDWSASCLKGWICIYTIYVWLSWRPSSAGAFVLGMWNFLDILHVRFMFIEPSKWPADQDCLVYWFTWQSEGLYLFKISKNHTLVPVSVKYWQVYFPKVWCHEKLHKACILLEKDRNLFSLKPDQNRPKVQLWHGTCSKATAFACMVTTCARTVAKFNREGLLAYDFISNTWFIDISGASFKHPSKLCSPANRTRASLDEETICETSSIDQKGPLADIDQETSPLWRVGPVGPIII